MRKLQIVMLVCLVVLLGVIWRNSLISGTQARPNRVKQVARGVWFREGELVEMGHCNNIWIEMKDYLIVVDANYPSGAKACLENIRKTTQKSIKYVFDTHHHSVHAYGNPIWTRLGATTLAHIGVAEEMKRYEPKSWQEEAKVRKDVAKLNLSTAEPPQRTFKENEMVLEDSSRRVELHFFGWAHTRGDGIVYLPQEKIVCTGDVVVNGDYNYLEHANVANWPRVIEKIQKLKVATVLPGHGLPGSKDLLEGQKQFFNELEKAVNNAVKSGKKLEDIVQKDGTEIIGTTIRLPGSVNSWISDKPLFDSAYEEITQGKPHGEIVGGK